MFAGIFTRVLAAVFLWAFVSAAWVSPLPPTQDPFYEVPANVSGYENGDIINWRPTPAQLRSVYFPLNVEGSWQLLVRSEDSERNPTAFVTTVIKPYNAIPSKLLSYEAFEDSACLDCSPSYSVLYGASMRTFSIQVEVAMMNIGLSKNWYVVLPDYEGPKSAFSAGVQSGKATLDGIRAALKSSEITEISRDAKVGLFGFSGGSIAVGWAAQLQPEHAPELKDHIIGAAAGGFVTNMTLTAIAMDGTSYSGLAVAAVNGLVQEYSGLLDVLEKEINPTKLDTFYKARSLCLRELSGVYDLTELFTGTDPWMTRGLGFFDVPEVKKVLELNILALNGVAPEVPVFIFQGEQDDLAPFEQVQRVYDDWCSWGASSVEFAVSRSTGHLLEAVTGLGAAFAWLEDRFDGYLPVKGCLRTVRDNNIAYPGAYPNYQRLLTTFFRGIFGEKIGDDPSEETMLAKVLAFILGEWIGVLQGEQRTLESPRVGLAANASELRVFKGLGDVVDLWRKEKIDPWRVLEEAQIKR
ncbi:hypothetical protein C7M61_005246 [Candidozyma pseudohaemuli]|uniref:Triacylglycerol lipase n=1 Tax=Candidozyma pseudohaemuli TaxID=418784 RepID=A0A2P7YCK3_9ASCO|nr:hypothetical protein C7M61_005246 [[Candida] pseudohaemulonii]PSK33693.1 hypothetical protein C7M61_005246 [[Candida] pseudohaemulonii]